MATLVSSELLHVLVDAFRAYTEATLFVGGSNPYRFSLNGKYVSVFIRNTHPARRSDDDEFRIQCPGDLPSQFGACQTAGDTVVVLGFHPDWKVFTAWDPARFLARNTRSRQFSMYARLSKIREASNVGVSTYRDSNQQNVLSFRPEFAGLYVENSRTIHEISDARFNDIAQKYAGTQTGQRAVGLGSVKGQRITVTRNQYVRSPQFRVSVLEAYFHSCAMCGVQLDLIDAAHVVPHADPSGSDAVTNGIALCSLHHRSFDTGLLYVDPTYKIHVNQDRLSYLRKLDRAGGLTKYRRGFQDNLTLPTDVNLHPSPQNIALEPLTKWLANP